MYWGSFYRNVIYIAWDCWLHLFDFIAVVRVLISGDFPKALSLQIGRGESIGDAALLANATDDLKLRFWPHQS
ncbi:hypothetical protein MKW98_024858 [Papaver atlanticum]|uniref:Uncharacterized protein n=1 Tax=Papaver atlanticum TaxID=357466 RepID=A0AAD4T7A1_9MAGN|nr:hypothetical protein MKW98_024858 [Papaver atlanticum]